MEVEEDQVGVVALRQLDAEPPVHGGQDANSRPLPDDALDEGMVGEVVLDVDDGCSVCGRSGVAHRIVGRAVFPLEPIDRVLDDGKIEPESATNPRAGLY